MSTTRDHERGQALALGVFGLLILAIGMYLVASFGRHVQQKIQAQTVADSVALSLATVEAESLNFIALTNRAQVANYVSMLNTQAYVSYLSWVELAAIEGASVTQTAAIPVAAIPIVGAGLSQALKTVSDLLFQLYQTTTPILDSLDVAAGTMNDQLVNLNRALWVTQMVVAWLVTAELASGGHEFFREATAASDPEWSNTSTTTGAANAALGLYNVWKYNDAFFRPGGKPNPFETRPQLPQRTQGTDSNSDVAVAQRVMTEIVNGSRGDDWLLDRTMLMVPGVLGDAARLLENAIDKIPGFPDIAKKRGESKIVNRTGDSVGTIDTIYANNFDDSVLNRGGVMASEDRWLISGSVWARDDDSSRHCRAKPGQTRVTPRIPFTESPHRQCKERSEDRNHAWPGILPYMSYNVGRRTNGIDEDFHQPDVWIWLHKPQALTQLARTIDFTLTAKNGESQQFSAGVPRGGSSVFEPGIHVFARAQAYYHRPGNWAEPPNLFNPYWRARLAPIDEGIAGLAGGLDSSVLSDITTLVGSEWVTH